MPPRAIAATFRLALAGWRFGQRVFGDLEESFAVFERQRAPRRGEVHGQRRTGIQINVGSLFTDGVDLQATPPMTEYTYLGGNSSLYDSIGRYFVLGVSAKL